MQEVWAVKNICDILVDIFGFHSFRLAMAEVGRRFGGTVYRERRICKWERSGRETGSGLQ